MRPIHTWLAAALLLGALGAQDEAAKPVDADARLKQLVAEQQEIYAAWREQIQRQAEEAKKDPSKASMSMRMRPDYSALAAKYLAAADGYPDRAAEFLVPALNLSEGPEAYREIIDRLLADHLDSAAIGQLGGRLGYLDQMVGAGYAAEVTAKIKAHGKNATLMGWVAVNEHEQTFRSAAPDSDAFRKAKAVVVAAVAKADDASLQRTWNQLITETEKFGIGMTAPDIAGVDLDGVAFKLSDYKGKVVFLDFWGDW